MGKPEGRVESYLRDRCKRNGFLCYKFTSPGTSGVPDRVVIARGRTVFVELKAETGKLSELQKYRITEMKDAGADVRVISSRPGVDAFIKEMNGNEER